MKLRGFREPDIFFAAGRNSYSSRTESTFRVTTPNSSSTVPVSTYGRERFRMWQKRAYAWGKKMVSYSALVSSKLMNSNGSSSLVVMSFLG